MQLSGFISGCFHMNSFYNSYIIIPGTPTISWGGWIVTVLIAFNAIYLACPSAWNNILINYSI
jgi:hypothetical protein